MKHDQNISVYFQKPKKIIDLMKKKNTKENKNQLRLPLFKMRRMKVRIENFRLFKHPTCTCF